MGVGLAAFFNGERESTPTVREFRSGYDAFLTDSQGQFNCKISYLQISGFTILCNM